MKNLKKILGGALVAVAAFGFFGCSDTEEDEELVVEISYNESSKTVTMTTPEKYDGKDVYIAYTLDGSDVTVTYDKTAYDSATDKSKYGSYFDYGTATIYSGSFKLSESAEIVAKAFYIDSTSAKAVLGPVAKKSISITNESASSSTDSADNAKGTSSFKIASSGNSNMIHYFDTSDATFKYGDYEHCYYQLMFSYKGSGIGKWYLYYRQLSNGAIIPASETQKYMATGDYAGPCFNSSSGKVDSGDIVLKKSDGSIWTTVTVVGGDNPSFDLEVSGSATTLVDDAK